MPLFKTSRKVHSFGSSLALTLPAMYAKINDIEKGNQVCVYYDINGNLILSKCKNEEELRKNLMLFIKTLDEDIYKK